MARSRQLAAIMFTDIEGYTALMQRDEEKAISVRDRHRHIFNTSTKKFNGKVVQYYGDGTLSIFDSAIAAVDCAIEMQLDFQDTPSIPVRIGIHTGDIIISEEDIIGDGVNVASRIESLSVPGSVFISEKVYDDVKNQDSIKTSFVRQVNLKNVSKPIKIYAIANAGLIVPDAEDIEGKIGNDASDDQDKKRSRPDPIPILSTKLYIPSPRPNALPRPRLIEQMNEGLSRRLILIAAPAGFGKTSLVSEWIAGCERPVAWLALDDADNDPLRFLAHFISAMQTLDENIGKGVHVMLQNHQKPSSEPTLTLLINEVGQVSDNFTFVLDDYHVIHDGAVREMVEFLLENLPPKMLLVITTRESPALPLPRLRVRDQLVELGISDLRFTNNEAAQFLNKVMGLSLTDKDISTLESRTEGWVAGLQLAALSLKGHKNSEEFIKTFAGDDRYIVDYLVEEVLQNQPENVRRFLLDTSVLNRLSAPLCDALTGQNNGREVLEYLEHDNLFVVSMDEKRQWYRYHQLFLEVLHSHLLLEQPDQVAILHQRASAWYEQNNLLGDAVRHSISARDFERVANLIELVWPLMLNSYQTNTWMNWANTIPDKLKLSRPVIIVGYAWSMLNSGELEAAELRLLEAEKCLKANANQIVTVDQEQLKLLPRSIANARAFISQAHGDIPGTKKYAQQALDLLPEDDYLARSVPIAFLGFAHWASGELDEAYESFSGLRKYYRLENEISFLVGSTFLLADIRITQGRLRDAERIFGESLQIAKEQEGSTPQGLQDVYRGLSELACYRGELGTARKLLLKSREIFEQAGLPDDWRIRMCMANARLKEAEGDFDGALKELDEAERWYHRSPIPDVRPIGAIKARIWIKQGNLIKVSNWIDEQALSTDDSLSFILEYNHITLARFLIASDNGNELEKSSDMVLEFLDRLLISAEEGNRNGSVIELLVLQTLVLWTVGNSQLSLEKLERALHLAKPDGYNRIFVSEGLSIVETLSYAVSVGTEPDYAKKLLDAYEIENQNQ